MVEGVLHVAIHAQVGVGPGGVVIPDVRPAEEDSPVVDGGKLGVVAVVDRQGRGGLEDIHLDSEGPKVVDDFEISVDPAGFVHQLTDRIHHQPYTHALLDPGAEDPGDLARPSAVFEGEVAHRYFLPGACQFRYQVGVVIVNFGEECVSVHGDLL